MNIFVTSPDPRECARVLDDLRLNKMIVETAQILSTVLRKQGDESDSLYKSTHENHPCVLWASENRENFSWLVEHALNLAWEYDFRRNKIHGSLKVIEYCNMPDNYKRFQSLGLKMHLPKDFCNCTPFKDIDTFSAYKSTLIDKWNNDKKPPKWTKREMPRWYSLPV